LGGGEPAENIKCALWGHVLRFRLVGKEWAGIRHEKCAPPARFLCLRGGVSHGVYGNGYGGEGGVSTYIQCNNQKKNKPFVGMGTTTHPHPRRCHACAFLSPPGLPFVLSCPGIGLSFPGPLLPPCSVVDVPFGVVGGGIGAGDGGRRGSWSW